MVRNERRTWEHVWEECGRWSAERNWRKMMEEILGEKRLRKNLKKIREGGLKKKEKIDGMEVMGEGREERRRESKSESERERVKEREKKRKRERGRKRKLERNDGRDCRREEKRRKVVEEVGNNTAERIKGGG